MILTKTVFWKSVPLAVCGLLVLLSGYSLQAAELGKPTGPVVLTIAGNIDASNRGAFDKNKDSFLNYHDKTFEKAVEFDITMLEALGMHEIALGIEGWPVHATVEGPRLKDVLAAAGASAKEVTIVALDGFGSQISAEDIERLDWIVGVKADGNYLGIGERGPLWVVYDYSDGRPLTMEDEQRWPWAAFYIEVE